MWLSMFKYYDFELLKIMIKFRMLILPISLWLVVLI